MALRFMQIFVPEDASAKFDSLLEGCELLGTWRDIAVENRLVFQLLVPAEEAEPIMDRFAQAYSSQDELQIVLLPVEAALPRPKLEGDEESLPDEQITEGNATTKVLGRVGREELYSDISETLPVNRVFVAMTILSAVVAVVGLVRDDVAVIIGAMVIAPLLGPNVAMALSTTLGDLHLLRRACVTNVVGITLVLIVAFFVGATLAINPSVPAIASRTHLRIGDLVLALAAGSAGTFAFTRGLAGAVIGVMVAVALMPPLVVFGILFASGHFAPALGALLLVSANVICVNLAGVATFLAQGVRPRTWWEEKRAKKASRIAIVTWLIFLAILTMLLFGSRLAGSD